MAGRVIRFRAKTNGVITPYGFDSVREGDLYQCPSCGAEIVIGFGDPYDASPKMEKLLEPYRILKGVVDSK
jgi:hypothetical protein